MLVENTIVEHSRIGLTPVFRKKTPDVDPAFRSNFLNLVRAKAIS